jgi:hypothetical protein
MPTLILSPRQTDDAQRLWRAAIALGWKTERGHGRVIPEIDPAEAVPYGEPWFVHYAAETLGLALLEPPIDWLPNLPERFRQRTVRAMTLGEAREVDGPVFIKPADEKAFAAKIYSSGNELPARGLIPDEQPVLVQDVVHWEREYRCFVLHGMVTTVSIYSRDHELAQSRDGDFPFSDEEFEAAKSFCESAVAAYASATPTAVVVDVGLLAGRNWAVIEANAANSSGLYGCDPIEVLRVLRAAVSPASPIGESRVKT